MKKTTFFGSCFRHISLCFYSNFDRERFLDAELNSTYNEYPYILLTHPATPKTWNNWKKVRMTSSSHFFKYFLFLGYWGLSKVCRVGTCWMRNLIPYPMTSPDRNLSKYMGDMSKIQIKKIVFFISSSKINKYYFINFF